MTHLDGEYEPSPAQWVRDQVAEYESSGGQRANTLADTGLPVVIVTTRGNKSGKIRKTPLMRVEHDGQYVLVASKGGAPEHPEWYNNLVAAGQATVEVGTSTFVVTITEVAGDERDRIFAEQVKRMPGFGDYAKQTEGIRTIPVLRLTRR